MAPKGAPGPRQYDGSHQKSVMYLVASDEAKVFRMYDKFDMKTFLQFLKLVYKKFGMCMIFLDKASQHTSKTVERWAREHGMILCYFPTGTPERNVVKQYRNETKRGVAVAKSNYLTHDVRCATSTHYGTMKPHLSVEKYLYRKLDPVLTNF